MNRQRRREKEPRQGQTHDARLPISQQFPPLDAEDQDVPAPYIHPVLEVCRYWTLTTCTWLEVISKWVLSTLSMVLEACLAKTTTRFLWAGIIIILACVFGWGYCQQLVDNHLCPSIDSICSDRYNSLSLVICPVVRCGSYPSSTAEAAPSSMVSPSILYNHTEQQQHISTLFRSPYSLRWSAAGLNELKFFIKMSHIPRREKETLNLMLTDITETIKSIDPQASSFTFNYTHSLRTIGVRIRLFENVLVKTIENYAASSCPSKDFLHHNTSAAGWRVKLYALFARYTTCKFFDAGSAAAWNTTIVLQAHFKELLTISRRHLSDLSFDASTMSTAISLLENQLTIFLTHAAPSLHDLDHRIHHDKPGFWAYLSKIRESKGKFSWINADKVVLERCNGDLLEAMRVIGDINFRISQADSIINDLETRLRGLQTNILHDGWGSASVLHDTAELRRLLEWMDGGAWGKLEMWKREAEEEAEKQWKKPWMVLEK